MSLSAWEQQALRSIEDGLTASDPKLASLLATFTRLTSGEAMPVRQKIRARWRRATRRPRGSHRHPRPGSVSRHASRLGQCVGWPRVVLLLSLAAALAVTAVMLIIGSGPAPACRGSWALVCVQQPPARSSRPAARPRTAGQAAEERPAPGTSAAPPGAAK